MKIKRMNAKHDGYADQSMLAAARAEANELLNKYSNSYEGYNETEVFLARQQYGSNKIDHGRKESILKKLFNAFINPFTVILIALATISFTTDLLIAEVGDKDPTAVIIISTMILLSGMLRFIQEFRSDKAAESLTAMIKTTATVQRRENGKVELPVEDLVTGDIIYLSAGDMVPADIRILKAKDLFISQSSLTGESLPVEKFSEPVRCDTVMDCTNLAFMGSNIISGTAIAIVIHTGGRTLFGEMAKHINVKKTVTAFEKGVNSVSWVLIRFMLVMVPVVLFINGFTKGNWTEAFFFALSVAVGLTPEMLPMIVSANLAKGSVSMSRRKVIVKKLNAIQNFGAMDILCTDKTGTITQDKVVLVHSLDIQGKEDKRVLRHAYLNSWYQTGLKNLMDLAIIEFAEKESILQSQAYTKVDEIPFDFERRRMSVVVADNTGKTQLITKGAIEEMLAVSTFAEYKGTVTKLTEEMKKEITDTVMQYNRKGMRVLGVAQKTNPAPAGVFSVTDESEMVLMGYLAFLDPPKASTTKALEGLKEYGVTVKILTGDNDAVTGAVCAMVGISDQNIILGAMIDSLNDIELRTVAEQCNIFAKLSPVQKTRIVKVLRNNGHTVGYMGDGINDAAAMKASDIAISVDTAVDIAKESADIILLEKDLTVLEEGIIEGRKTYANIIKYIKMTASSNFGNMFSVLAASAFLPFLPMIPVQLLFLNMIYDVSCMAIPWDNVDQDYLKKSRKWDAGLVSKFMLRIGPTSSIFDITTYFALFFFICPFVVGGAYHTLNAGEQAAFTMLFHTGWFVESLWTQTLVIHMIRTPHIPFLQSRASLPLIAATSAGLAVGTFLPYTGVGAMLGMAVLPLMYYPMLASTIALYMAVVTIAKKSFVRKYGELL